MAILPSSMQLAYRVRRRMLALLGWRMRGVKLIVTDGHGHILLVRHRYGPRDLLMLPGGGIRRREAPVAAAARELLEETGCAAIDLTLLARHESRADGRRDTVFLFAALTHDAPVPDGREVAEACFVDVERLPADVSPATRRRIEEWQGRRPRGTAW